MKKIFIYLTICFLTIITACDDDKDMFTVSGLESSELLESESDIELTIESKDAIMLSLTWNESELTINSDSLSIPDDVPSMNLQVSDSESFDSYETYEPDDNVYAFTGNELNTLASDFGFTAGDATPMYFRMKSAYGDNTDAYYSNVVTVTITSYDIDYTKGYILDTDDVETGYFLSCPNEDGEYAGFVAATAWYNWRFKEGDGTVWGNDDGGTPFLISSNTTWSFWFPEPGGCYYTTLSTNDSEWTATYLPDLMISGDYESEMTFVKADVAWYATVITTTDNATVKVSCSDAALYNITSGTDDASAVAKEMGFVADATGGLTFEESASAATDITIATAGTYTLAIYLSDPTNWHYEVTEGAYGEETTVYEQLYLPGVDDLISGSWTFDNSIPLLSEDALTYAGVVNVSSEWGYTMSVEVDNWSDFYGMGDAEGALAWQGSNITPPDAGLYLIQADLANLTYSHTAIGDQVYVTGLNDIWNFTDVVLSQSESDAGVYTGTAEVTGTTSYGVKIYLDTDWTNYYGGSTSKLVLNGGDASEATSLAVGTYTVTVDLINRTCAFELQ